MLHLSRRTTIAIEMFIVALAVMAGVVWVYDLIQTGGEGMGTTQVSDFSLCAPTESGTDRSATLTAHVVSPTSVVHVAGI